jgi:hypothetical protein
LWRELPDDPRNCIPCRPKAHRSFQGIPLTVKFHDNRPNNVFKITKYTYTNNSVRIDWLNRAKESVTVFAEFSGSKMAQQQNGGKPRRLSNAAETSSYLEKLGAMQPFSKPAVNDFPSRPEIEKVRPFFL